MPPSFRDSNPVPTWLLAGGPAPSLYRSDAVLELHLPGLDTIIEGREEIVAHLSTRWRPGTRVETLSDRHSSSGLQLRVEVTDPDGLLSRERHLIHWRDQEEEIELHVIYPERVPFVAGDEALSGAPAKVVDKTALPPGFSGAPIEKVVLDDQRSLIVKHIAARWSWVMRATQDDGREASIWTEGVRLPAGVDTAIVESLRLADRWLLYMNDVSGALSGMTELPRADEAALLGRLAAIGGDAAHDASLCPLTDRLSLFSPATTIREADGTDLGPKIIGRGWQLVQDLVPGDLFDLASELASDPEPLSRALSASRCALLHGDLRPGNFGLEDGRLVVIDWGLASWGPPALDLTWYLFNRRWPAGLEEGLSVVREALGHPADDDALDLAVIATFVQACPYFGFTAVQDPDSETRARTREDLAAWVFAAHRSLERTAHLLSA